MQILPLPALNSAQTSHPFDAVIVPVFANGLNPEALRPVASKNGLDACVKAAAHSAKAQAFTGAAKQEMRLSCGPQAQGRAACAPIVIVLGLGEVHEATASTWLHAGGRARAIFRRLGTVKGAVILPSAAYPSTAGAQVPTAGAGHNEALALICRGLYLGGYEFLRLKTKISEANAAALARVAVIMPGASAARIADMQTIVRHSRVVAESVAMARDLVNLPPNVLYPETFALFAQKVARKEGLKCQILDAKALKARGMNLILGVGQGSQHPPRLVHLSYSPKGHKRTGAGPTALIGKGITFDSGGLCLKPADAQVTMKMDMGGAAAVLATLVAAARLKLKTPLAGILALAENMPSGTALRTGDVLKSAQGTSVEVNNTDAEGRLVLADAIHYAKQALAPVRIVDLATLTGACMVALGQTTTGLFANDEALAAALLAGAAQAGEHTWRLPLTPALKEQLHSDVADMRNTGERYGGAITAALFLQSFVGQTPWAHMDIAGPAWSTKEQGHLARGGTGVGVATLIAWLLNDAAGRSRG